MDQLRRIAETGWFGISPDWMPVAGFGVLLLTLAMAELAWPFRGGDGGSGRRFAANFGLGLINALILSLVPLSSVAAAQWARIGQVGLFNDFPVPTLAVVVATLTLRSLANYVLHRLAHRLPWLWRMHQVHHADTDVDLSTGLRHHPAEVLYMAAVIGGLAILLGLSPAALAGYEIVAAGFALWSHANLRLPDRLDRGLSWLFVSPRVHHVHHSDRQTRTDSNYGDVLTVWDRLFGTYHDLPSTEVARQRCGLGDDYDSGASDLLVQLRSPFMLPDAGARA